MGPFAAHLGLALLVLVSPAAPSEVAAVFPSADTVPANLLRISVVFRVAPAPGMLHRIALHDATGAAIDQPFLDQELWSPDGTTLTILLHPGRVKRGLIARDLAGPVLRPEAELTLRLDGHSIKAWRVGPPATTAPDPAGWTVHPPRPGTRAAVVVEFPASIDFMAAGYLVVVSPGGERVVGRAALLAGERGWSLTPERAWMPGRYRLLIHPRLEDPQGNALRSRFEQPAGQATAAPVRPATIDFDVVDRPLDPVIPRGQGAGATGGAG